MNKSQKPAISFASKNVKCNLNFENLQKLQNNVVKFLSYQTDTKTKNTEQLFEDFFVVAFEKFLNFNELQGKKLNEESFILDGETVKMNYISYLQSVGQIANVANVLESPLQTYAKKKTKNENTKDYVREISYEENVMVEGRGKDAGTLIEITKTNKISYIKDLNLFVDSKELFFILVKYTKQAFFNEVKNAPKMKDIETPKIFAKVSESQKTTIENDILASELENSIFDYFDIDEEKSICEALKYQIVIKVNNKKIIVCTPKNISINPTIESVQKRLNAYIAFFKKQKNKIKETISLIEVREIPCDKYDNLIITENDKLEMLNSIC